MRKMEFQDWQQFSRSVHERAERIRRMILYRARTACREAGLDPDLLGIHPHNAMLDYQAGRPWRGVDYSKCRLALRLTDLAFEPGRIADRLSSRAWKKVQFSESEE